MEISRFLSAAVRRQEYLPWMPASISASYAPRQEGKFHLVLPSTEQGVAYGRSSFTFAVSSSSTPPGIFCSPTKFPLSAELTHQASRHATLCSAVVKPISETRASLYRRNRFPLLCRMPFPDAQQAAAFCSTTSTPSTSASPSPSSAGLPGDEANGDDDSAHLRAKLDELVKNTAVVLFMKGSPQAPQCGFSARAVALLEASDIEDYTFVNILKYPDIRSLAKKHFRWPTYPLLIVGGEVVGGIDIMEELNKTGELKQMMQNAVEKRTKTQSN